MTTYTITYTADDIEIIQLQEAIADGDGGYGIPLLRALDYIMRLLQESKNLRERVAALEKINSERAVAEENERYHQSEHGE